MSERAPPVALALRVLAGDSLSSTASALMALSLAVLDLAGERLVHRVESRRRRWQHRDHWRDSIRTKVKPWDETRWPTIQAAVNEIGAGVPFGSDAVRDWITDLAPAHFRGRRGRPSKLVIPRGP